MKKKTAWYTRAWKTPWMRNTGIGIGVLLLTFLGYFGQQYAEWLGASLVGVPTCVTDTGKITILPVSGVVSSLTEASITKAIEEKKISSLHGKLYSKTPTQLKDTFTKMMSVTSGQDLSTLQSSEYEKGGHIGIDIPVWWSENKENMSVVSPFQNAEVYRIFKVSEGSNTWGNAVTLCFSNEHGTYFAHFAHLRDEPTATVGQKITAGQQLGYVGNTGNSYGAHLHFQINKFAKYNPYYTSDAGVIKSTFVDPLLLAFREQLAYGGNVLVAGPTPTTTTTTTTTTNLAAASIVSINLSPSANEAKVGEKVKVTVEAKDESGNPVSGKVLVSSSVPAGLPSEKQITNGTGELEIAATEASNVKLTVTNEKGDVSKDVTVAFTAPAQVETTSTTTQTSSTTEEAKKNVEDIFTDIQSVTSSEKSAIQYLWDNKITTGCAADKFCPNDNLNRAAAATFLIRTFYPTIDLNSVTIGSMPFSDVETGAWYAPAMYIASLTNYNGVEKTAFIKGSDGKAMPANNVKLEEFSAMILRVLKVEVTETAAWYEGYLTKMTEISLISQSEASSYLGKSIPRKMVARILHQAKLWHDQNPNGLALPVAAPAEPAAVVEETEPEPLVISVEAPQSLTARKSASNQTILEWIPSTVQNTGYNVYRKTAGTDFELIESKLTTPQYMDFSAEAGVSYTYKVDTEDLNTGEKSASSNEVVVQS